MTEKFVIHGGKRLKGSIEVRGSKNAAFAVLAATLLTKEECIIDNLPLIEDVKVLLEILKSIGVRVTFISKRKVKISAAKLDPRHIRHDLVEQVRASVLLCGALPARVSRFRLFKPGGCSIGARILDPHFSALAPVGVSVRQKGKYLEVVGGKAAKERDVVLSEMSVTATENVVLAAVLKPGITSVYCAAAEPHVQDLCHMLARMGADIKGIGTNMLVIRGVKTLKGASHTVIPDTIEMGTFIALAAATKSTVTVRNVVPEFIRFELLKFKEANVRVRVKNEKKTPGGWGYRSADISVLPSTLRAVKKVHNLPYPGFSSDLIPIFAVLMTQARGVSLVHDWMYEGRMKYIEELRRMGADAFVCDPHRALITGPIPLEAKDITSFDLRAGATLIIAGLLAKGTTVISNIQQVDRGYEEIESRLRRLGAQIRRL